MADQAELPLAPAGDYFEFAPLLRHMSNTVTEGCDGYRQMVQRSIDAYEVRDELSRQYRVLTGETWSIKTVTSENDGNDEITKIVTVLSLFGDAKTMKDPCAIIETQHCLTGDVEYTIHVRQIPQTLQASLIGQKPTALVAHDSTLILDDAGVTIRSFDDSGDATIINLTSIIHTETSS
jgi:hypothetical protein